MCGCSESIEMSAEVNWPDAQPPGYFVRRAGLAAASEARGLELVTELQMQRIKREVHSPYICTDAGESQRAGEMAGPALGGGGVGRPAWAFFFFLPARFLDHAVQGGDLPPGCHVRGRYLISMYVDSAVI